MVSGYAGSCYWSGIPPKLIEGEYGSTVRIAVKNGAGHHPLLLERADGTLQAIYSALLVLIRQGGGDTSELASPEPLSPGWINDLAAIAVHDAEMAENARRGN